MYRSGPDRSKRSEKPLNLFATPTTASVRPRRVPRQPRGPAPNGKKEKDESAPPRSESSQRRAALRVKLGARGRGRGRGEKHAVAPRRGRRTSRQGAVRPRRHRRYSQRLARGRDVVGRRVADCSNFKPSRSTRRASSTARWEPRVPAVENTGTRRRRRRRVAPGDDQVKECRGCRRRRRPVPQQLREEVGASAAASRASITPSPAAGAAGAAPRSPGHNTCSAAGRAGTGAAPRSPSRRWPPNRTRSYR